MKKNIVVLLGGIIGISCMIFTYFKSPLKNEITFATYKNDELIKLVEKENYKVKNITEEEYLKQKSEYISSLEKFDYVINGDSVEITDYNGVSENLIIPDKIEDKPVTSIKASALKENIALKSITISKNINKLNINDFKKVTINCFKGTYCDSLKKNKKLKVNILKDSVNVIFDNTKTNFRYKFNNGDLKIKDYLDEKIIIPETFNGYEVKSISSDLKILPRYIYIPKTVKKLNILDNLNNNKKTIKISIAIEFIATLLFIIMTILINKITKKTTIYAIPIYFISYVYLLSVLFINYNVYVNNIRNSLMISIVYLLLSIVCSFGIKNINKSNKKN